jgi:hypothetical protein
MTFALVFESRRDGRGTIVIILHLINDLLTALADDRSAVFLWSYLSTNLRTLTSRQYRDAYLPLLFTDPELVERT